MGSTYVMRSFRAEYGVDYSTYSFGYAEYAVPEHPDDLAEIYGSGFLPYTDDLSLGTQVFYLARSLRVDIPSFSDTSENRRLDRRAHDLSIEVTLHPVTEFAKDSPRFLSFCERYAAERFSGGAMPRERLEFILNGSLLTHIVEFASATTTFGYVLAVIGDGFLHYWFAFFDTAYLHTHSLGKWMMWRTICLARDSGLSHVYLGTCYGQHGLYKARDHKGVAFFDGTGWNSDLKLLKTLAHRDDEGRHDADLFKARDDPRLASLFAPYLGREVD